MYAAPAPVSYTYALCHHRLGRAAALDLIRAPRITTSKLGEPGQMIRDIYAGLADIYDGLREWRMWWMLAWNDVRRRYRRSVLGQF